MIPYMVITFVFYFAFDVFGQVYYNQISFVEYAERFSGAIFDVLLLQITGIYQNLRFNAWWYLSALAFTLPLAIILFRKAMVDEGGYRWLIIATPLIIYGYFSIVFNGLEWEPMIGMTRSGFFRGVAGLCMGGNIFCLSQCLSKCKITGWLKMTLTVMEVGVYVLSVLVSWKFPDITNATFIIVTLLVIGLTITFSSQSYTTRLNCKVFVFLGALATPLYICHFSVGRLIGLYLSTYNGSLYCRYLIYVGISISFAVFMLVINRMLDKRKA